MRAALLCVSLVAGCDFVEERDRPGTLPGGPGGISEPGEPPDAPGILGDGDGQVLVGRVCLMRDLRAPTSGCAIDGAGNLVVTLGTKFTLTNPDGTFALELPVGSGLTWRVTGAGLVPTVMPFSADLVIPAISIDDHADLLISNGRILVGEQGVILVRVAQNNVLVPGVVADTNPDAVFATLYDGASPDVWDIDSTGGFGAAWMAGVPIGPATVTILPPSGIAQSMLVPVEDQAITFATIEIP